MSATKKTVETTRRARVLLRCHLYARLVDHDRLRSSLNALDSFFESLLHVQNVLVGHFLHLDQSRSPFLQGQLRVIPVYGREQIGQRTRFDLGQLRSDGRTRQRAQLSFLTRPRKPAVERVATHFERIFQFSFPFFPQHDRIQFPGVENRRQRVVMFREPVNGQLTSIQVV